MYKIKVFSLNKDGKIEFTLEELQALLDEVAREAQITLAPAVEPPTCTPYDPVKPDVTWWGTGTTHAKKIIYRSPGPECETCPSRPNPDKIVIGDTPCTWCEKNQITCTSSSDTNSGIVLVNQEVDKTSKI